jgi:hypothetical protein
VCIAKALVCHGVSGLRVETMLEKLLQHPDASWPLNLATIRSVGRSRLLLNPWGVAQHCSQSACDFSSDANKWRHVMTLQQAGRLDVPGNRVPVMARNRLAGQLKPTSHASDIEFGLRHLYFGRKLGDRD